MSSRSCWMETVPQTRWRFDNFSSPVAVRSEDWIVRPLTTLQPEASKFAASTSSVMGNVVAQLPDAEQPRTSTRGQPKQTVGASVGAGTGTCVGLGLGDGVGFGVGSGVGRGVGAKTGLAVGSPGSGVGAGIGCGVGDGVGPGVGCDVGFGVGCSVGCGVGRGVGTGVGTRVGAQGCGSQFALLAAHMKLPAAAQEAEEHVVGLPDSPG